MNELRERLDGLAARLECDGAYVDANIVVTAYVELYKTEPPTWRAMVEQLWPAEARQTCSMTGLKCLPGCNGTDCAGKELPLDQWPAT